MNRYWISWVQETLDYRPIIYPVYKQIIGYWCSGYEKDFPIMCALVQCDNKGDAQILIYKHWPEAIYRDWRFFDKLEIF